MNSPPQRYEPMVAMICLEKNEWEGGRIVLVVVQFAQLLARFFSGQIMATMGSWCWGGELIWKVGEKKYI